MNPTIRKFTAEDIPQVYAIERESYPEPWPEQAFKDELGNEFSYFYVADNDGLILGFYDLWQYANVAHLLNIAIRRNYREKGLGRILLEHCIKEASKLGVDLIFLEVRVSNAVAISLYEKFAFRKAALKPGYYCDGENAVVMILELDKLKRDL